MPNDSKTMPVPGMYWGGRAKLEDAGMALQQAMDWGLRNVMTFERVHIWISRAAF